MGGGKKKKDPAKELAKKQRKAAKQERCAAKREGKLAGPDEEVDLLALIAAQRLKDAARTEVTVAKLEPPTDGAFAPFPPRCNASLAAVGDDLYLFGGELNEGDQTTVFNDLYRYRTAKDEWYAVASLNAPSPRCAHQAVALGKHVYVRAAQESEIPNFKGSDLGHFPLVSADFWTSDHLSERSRSVGAFPGTHARETLTLKRR